MRLEIGTFPVEDVVFESRTRWRDGLLRRPPGLLSLSLRGQHLPTKLDIVQGRGVIARVGIALDQADETSQG